MYICLDCGRTFSDPYYIGIDYDAGNEPVFVCPHCHKMNYHEAVYCTECETWYDEESVKVHEGICETCLDRFYTSYLGLKMLQENPMMRKDFMKWCAIPLVLENHFLEKISVIQSDEWDEDDRRSFLINLNEYFVDDKYWFSTQIINPTLNRYDFGSFAIEFCSKKFFSFLQQKWDPFFKPDVPFTAYYYGVKDAKQETADALMHFIQSQFDAAEKGSSTGQSELNRIVTAMSEFARENRHVQVAYCHYCERC